MLKYKCRIKGFIIGVIIASIMMSGVTGFAEQKSNALSCIHAVLFADKNVAIKPSLADMKKALAIINKRLDYKGIKNRKLNVNYLTSEIDFKVYTSDKDIKKDPKAFITDIIKPAVLTFQEADENKKDKNGDYLPTGKIILKNGDISRAIVSTSAMTGSIVVSITLNNAGTKKFTEATARLAKTHGVIAIFIDSMLIAAPIVAAEISDGRLEISGNFTIKEADKLSKLISSGSLPFKLGYKKLTVK